MADSTTLEMRTRSHLTLPDSTLQLDRSPLKEARSAFRNRVSTTGETEEGDSDEDPILLSPKKTATNSQKRALESPQASYAQLSSRYKRFKSSDPEIRPLVKPTKRSHSRHLSESTVVENDGPNKRSAPPSIVKKSSSSSSQKTPPNHNPRAKSVPVFPSLSSIPSIDFRNPPVSPTRSRSRSPDKREPKLDITFVSTEVALDSIPDEAELAMDVDTPTPTPKRPQRSGSEQRSSLLSAVEATPKPSLQSTHSLAIQDSTVVPDLIMAPSKEPSTPSQSFFPEPLSPLTPLVETPAPSEKIGIQDRYLAEGGWGGTREAEVHADFGTPTRTAHPIGLTIDTLTTTNVVTNNPVQVQRPNRVPLPKKPKVNSPVNCGPFVGPPPTAASTSKSTGAGNKKTGAPENAFSLLMSHRQPMTAKDKETQNKMRKMSSRSAGKAAEVKESKPKNAKKPSTIKSKMKARTKPQESLVVPTFADDEEEQDQAMDKDAPRNPIESPDEFMKFLDAVLSPTAAAEPGDTKMPSSPPTSLFSEDQDPHAEADPQIDSPTEEAEPLANYRSSSLFSLNDEEPIGVPADNQASDAGIDSDAELFSPLEPQLQIPAPEQLNSVPVAEGPTERGAEAVAIAAESEGSAPAPETTVVEQDPSPSGKGKSKRGPRKKAGLDTIRRPTRVTRSVSSRQQGIEASAPSSLHNGKQAASTATNGGLVATPPSTRNRRKKPELTSPTETNTMSTAEPSFKSEVSEPTNGKDVEHVVDPVAILEPDDRPDSALSSDLSALPSDSEDEPETIQQSKVLQPSTSSKSMKSQLPVKSKLAPSPSLARATQASIARAALPKTPTKSRSASMFASHRENQESRPELAVAGSSYVDLESLLHKLREAPPSRPNTSMGFNRDNLNDDSDVQMQSKDDASVERSRLGIGRPSSSASSSSKSSLPVFKRPAPVSKDSRGIFMQTTKGSAVNRKQGAIMRGGPSIYDRIAGGARGQKASQKTALPTVIGSPVKGGGVVNMAEEDVVMGDAEAGPSNVQGDLTLADLTMPDMDAEAESSSKGKTKAREDKSRRASMALHALTQSLNDISTARTVEAAQPPTPPRRAGLRSSSSTYPSSSSGKNATDGKKDSEPPRLSVLGDCKVFVDYRSEDPLVAETWVQMLKDLGARIMTRLGPTCTHILWKDGLASTINRYRLLNDPKPFVVGNSWVVSCAQESKRVDETEFLVELKDYTFQAAGHKRRKSMIPKFTANYGDGGDTEGTGSQDADVSIDSNTSISNDLTPLERARLRQSMRT